MFAVIITYRLELVCLLDGA